MIAAADYGIAYRAKPKAREVANGRIDQGDLTNLLKLFGIPESDWIEHRPAAPDGELSNLPRPAVIKLQPVMNERVSPRSYEFANFELASDGTPLRHPDRPRAPGIAPSPPSAIFASC